MLMITAYATVENAVAAFRRGAQDYLMKPVIFDELLAKIDRLMGYPPPAAGEPGAAAAAPRSGDPGTLVGDSPAMRAVEDPDPQGRADAEQRADHRRVGHGQGTGRPGPCTRCGTEPEAPFLAVNCAAIPHDLLENQLFGHVRGAFTGADRDHAGLFVAAGRGTVFLDEIGELSPATQAKLLRAIETKEVLPVGATRPVPFPARVVAATNKDLPAEVAAGRFRADLYYRLNVVSIHLPPLRDRREDIPELVAVLLARHARRLGKRVDGVDNATIRGLMAAPWKGNVRELDNALERAVILGDGPILTPDDFPPGLVAEADARDPRRATTSARPSATTSGSTSGACSPDCGDDKREAARRLGLGLSSLYRKLEELEIRTN